MVVAKVVVDYVRLRSCSSINEILKCFGGQRRWLNMWIKCRVFMYQKGVFMYLKGCPGITTPKNNIKHLLIEYLLIEYGLFCIYCVCTVYVQKHT